MSEPFLAEIRMVGFNFAPRGWAFCDGQLLPINQNQALYSLLGTTYGGDGRTSFALPDLRGRTPIHRGNGFALGQRGGEETHALSAQQIPQHGHELMVTDDPATAVTPLGGTLSTTGANAYGALTAGTAMAAGSVASTGDGQRHGNMAPFVGLNFAIALQGLFPSRN